MLQPLSFSKPLRVLQCVTVAVCVAVCRSVLQCIAVCLIVLQFVAVCCNVLQYAEPCHNVLRYVTMCYDMSQCVAFYCSVLRCVACITMCCIILQCVAVCRMHHNAFPYIARCLVGNALYCTLYRKVSRYSVARHVAKSDVVSRCYTLLSHAATPYNTLQLTATHCRRAPLALNRSPCSFHPFLLLFSRKKQSIGAYYARVDLGLNCICARIRCL